MNVKATATMRKYLQKNVPEYKFNLLEMTREAYTQNVDYDIFRNAADYNPEHGTMKVIQVVYPAECYAIPRYLTTADLIKVFRHCDRTENGFIHEIRNEIAI